MLDLKYSGDIAGHSHVVLLALRPRKPAGEPTGEDEIIIGKIREGCKGPVPVRFNTDRLEFEPRYKGGLPMSGAEQHSARVQPEGVCMTVTVEPLIDANEAGRSTEDAPCYGARDGSQDSCQGSKSAKLALPRFFSG